MNNPTITQRKARRNERVSGPKLVKLYKTTGNGIPFVEDLAIVEKRNRIIPSNKRLDKARVGSDEWEGTYVYISWSGTMTGYEKPGKKLGESIVYTDPETKQRYVFPVPKNYKGAKNAILAVEHPKYTLVRDGKDLIIVSNPKNISLLERFPTSNGWYLTNEKHGIPIGNDVSSSNVDARYLERIEDGSRVGPIARMYLDHYCRYVSLHRRPSIGLGVVVEAPAQNEFEPLVGNARSNLDELIQVVGQEKLGALLKLVESLEKKK